MATWFHAAVLGVGVAATVAVGIASAAMLTTIDPIAAKGDRLAAAVDDGRYQTVETRRAGVSVLTRVHSD
jgi:hypothetical protein